MRLYSYAQRDVCRYNIDIFICPARRHVYQRCFATCQRYFATCATMFGGEGIHRCFHMRTRGSNFCIGAAIGPSFAPVERMRERERERDLEDAGISHVVVGC